MKRVLLTADSVGGVWSYTLDLAADWAARGVTSVLAVLGPSPDAAQIAAAQAIPGLELRLTGLPLDWTAPSPEILQEASEQLAQIARREQVESVHLHAPALIGAAHWPAPVVAVAHSCVGSWWRVNRGGDLPPDLAWRAAATRQGMRDAAAVIAPSAAFADLLRATYGLEKPLRVIHNGRAPASLPALKRGRRALTAGRLWDDAKNIETLDRAAARLQGEEISAAGALAPPGGRPITLRRLHPLGALSASELAKRYAASSVFVSVARYEPFGLAVLEAAQAGLALLLSDIPTFRELWEGAALFAPPDDKEAIAEALAALLRDPHPWAARAKAHAARYTVSAMAAASLDVHQSVLAPRELAR